GSFGHFQSAYVYRNNRTQPNQQQNKGEKNSLGLHQRQSRIPVGVALVGEPIHFIGLAVIGFYDPDARKGFLYERGERRQLPLNVLTPAVNDLVDHQQDGR